MRCEGDRLNITAGENDALQAEASIQKYLKAQIKYRTNDTEILTSIVASGAAITFDFRYHKRAFHNAAAKNVRIPLTDYQETQIASVCLQSYYEKNRELKLIDMLEESMTRDCSQTSPNERRSERRNICKLKG